MKALLCMAVVLSQINLHAQTIFAENIISTHDFNEYGLTFINDSLICFTKSEGQNTLMFSKFENNYWNKPFTASFSGIYSDEYPRFDPNSKILFFASKRPTKNNELKAVNDIWYVTLKEDNTWTEPIHLDGNFSTNGIDSGAEFSNGLVYFHSDRKGKGLNAVDIYSLSLNTPNDSAKYLAINSNFVDGEPFLFNNGKALLFMSAGHNSVGNSDLFLTLLENGNWTTPSPVDTSGKVNTKEWEYSPVLSPDLKTLYFTRYINGQADIIYIEVKDLTNEKLKSISNIHNECPNKVEVFGDSRLQNNVYRGSFSPDGLTFYFFKKMSSSTENYRIFQSINKDGDWSDPEWVNLGGEYSDMYPSISKDGNRIVFSSYRPIPEKYNSNEALNAHLWYCDKENGKWSKPIFMEEANKIGYYHSWVEFGWDNNIYFRRITPDWKSKETLVTKWDGAKYTKPVKFEEVEQWIEQLPNLKISGGIPGPSKNVVFLDVATQNIKTGERGSEIWVSVRKEQEWQKPVPLIGDVNKARFDNFPFISPNCNCFYFVRDFDKFYHISLNKILPYIN